MDASEYVRRVLEACRAAPGTGGAIRQPDRAFAMRLYERGVALAVVENVSDHEKAYFFEQAPAVGPRHCGV